MLREEYPFDIFMSHASDDKENVALPLRNALERKGCKVWMDQFEIKVGDSLFESVQSGIKSSRYGAILISEAFLKNKWTLAELRALFSLEEKGEVKILPIVHGLSHADLLSQLPLLSDRLYLRTDLGIDAVASRLLSRVEGFWTKVHSEAMEKLNENPGPVLEKIRRLAAGEETAVFFDGEYATKETETKIAPESYPTTDVLTLLNRQANPKSKLACVVCNGGPMIAMLRGYGETHKYILYICANCTHVYSTAHEM